MVHEVVEHVEGRLGPREHLDAAQFAHGRAARVSDDPSGPVGIPAARQFTQEGIGPVHPADEDQRRAVVPAGEEGRDGLDRFLIVDDPAKQHEGERHADIENRHKDQRRAGERHAAFEEEGGREEDQGRNN